MFNSSFLVVELIIFLGVCSFIMLLFLLLFLFIEMKKKYREIYKLRVIIIVCISRNESFWGFCFFFELRL